MNRQYITVYALNKYIKAKMNQDVSLQNVYIKGEVSNYRPHPSGHVYFTLKDENSRISAIMFASSAKKLMFQIENGMQVLIKATVSVYEATGQYQLYVQSMEQDGIGQLYLQFENLKKKLQNEGLFDESHKKEIPHFPKKIAVLSAKQGAAVQDVVRTIHLRFPFVRVIVFPIPVQGLNAHLKIVQTLKEVDRLSFDTIIIARGGGSIEDLWNFNEEHLARCIYECQTPIISGVGHETDFTICDFVSDVRCATPTAAAMRATPDQNELKIHCQELKSQLIYRINSYLKYHEQQLLHLKESYSLTNPELFYSNEILRLIHLQDRLNHQLQVVHIKMEQELKQYQQLLLQRIEYQMQIKIHHLQSLILTLDALSPLKVMQRGYTMIKKGGKVVKSIEEINHDDDIHIQFYDGICEAKIK